MAQLITVRRFVSEITPEMIEQGWVRSDEAAQSKDEWISVNEKLPENDDKVMVWFAKCNNPEKYSYEDFATYNNGRWERWSDEAGTDMERNPDYMGVTHWMPLPAPPKK